MQTGYSSAQGQCAGHGGEGEEGGGEKRWTLYSQLRRGRQGQILRDACVCVCVHVHAFCLCICLPVVLMYLFSIASL